MNDDAVLLMNRVAYRGQAPLPQDSVSICGSATPVTPTEDHRTRGSESIREWRMNSHRSTGNRWSEACPR